MYVVVYIHTNRKSRSGIITHTHTHWNCSPYFTSLVRTYDFFLFCYFMHMWPVRCVCVIFHQFNFPLFLRFLSLYECNIIAIWIYEQTKHLISVGGGREIFFFYKMKWGEDLLIFSVLVLFCRSCVVFIANIVVISVFLYLIITLIILLCGTK